MNKKNLSEVTEDAVTLSKNETILGHLTFKHAVSVAKDVSVSGDVDVDGLLNGINLGLLRSDVLLTDGNQIVKGKKVFVSEVECADDISINGSLNGINLKDDIVVQGRTQNIFGMHCTRCPTELTLPKSKWNILILFISSISSSKHTCSRKNS